MLLMKRYGCFKILLCYPKEVKMILSQEATMSLTEIAFFRKPQLLSERDFSFHSQQQ